MQIESIPPIPHSGDLAANVSVVVALRNQHASLLPFGKASDAGADR